MSDSHGHTPAAWTAVTIMFLGFLISGLALPFSLVWLFFVGLAVVALGAVVGKVMQMMGMGNTVAYKDARDPAYEHDHDHEPGHDHEGHSGRPESGARTDAPRG